MAKKRPTKKKLAERIPVYTPALVSILMNREKAKGAPLTKEEVLEIRDNATLILVDQSEAKAMAETRGYADLDPENTWNQWLKIKKKIKR